MTTIVLDDLRDGYREVLDFIIEAGTEVTVTGEQDTIEALDVNLIIRNATDTLPIGTGRKVNQKLAAIEALNVIGGVSTPELLSKVIPNMAKYQDAGIFHGAYGPRLRGQLPLVIDRLRADPSSRRAVITLWDPLHDLTVEDSHNYPCTTMLQFLVRDGLLHLFVTMRSNDAYHGLAYDAFVFSQLQATVANVLGLQIGPYHHHAASLHIYTRDMDGVDTVRRGPSGGEIAEDRPSGVHGRSAYEVMQKARHLLEGRLFLGVDAYLDGWYREAMRKALA